MNSLIKTGLVAVTTLMLAQPVLAQDADQAPPPQNDMRPYSQVELQQAYERGRSDQARDQRVAPPPPQGQPAGYCYQRQANARVNGTIIGAVLGGVIGNGLSDHWNRGGNTVGGALVGGMLGNAVGQDSVQCYQNAYYAYDDGYYAPPPPPRGYTTIYFSSAPAYGYGYRYYHGRPRWDHRGW